MTKLELGHEGLNPEQPFYASPFSLSFPLVPKVSAALWERMREAKLGFGGGRVTVGTAFEVVVRRWGDGVSPGRACPKRCANFGHENGGAGVSFRIKNFALAGCL